MSGADEIVASIAGTPGYMSPQQLRGHAPDVRHDVWSFGCVLWECLTGTQLFKGETVSDSLAAILRKDPDWSLLPGDTPPTFLWHTADGAGVPVENSLLFAQALSAHEVPHELHVYHSGRHGLGLAPEFPHIATWIATFILLSSAVPTRC